MIQVENLSFSYTKKKGEEVLKNISFSVNPGECVGILGNNGAGKSTLITCLCNIQKPQGGSVFLQGQDIYQMKPLHMARQLAYVAQSNEMYHMTVFDFVLLGRKPYMKQFVSKKDTAVCERVIEQLGLSGQKLKYITEISGGQWQKVLLARALAQEPKVLLLDEPINNLDLKNQHEILSLVQKLAKETQMSVLMVLHDVSLSLRYCSQFLFLKEGALHCYGDQTVVTEKVMEEVFDIQASIEKVQGQNILVVH